MIKCICLGRGSKLGPAGIHHGGQAASLQQKLQSLVAVGLMLPPVELWRLVWRIFRGGQTIAAGLHRLPLPRRWRD